MNNYFSNLPANLTNKENTESKFTTILNNFPEGAIFLSLKPHKLQ